MNKIIELSKSNYDKEYYFFIKDSECIHTEVLRKPPKFMCYNKRKLDMVNSVVISNYNIIKNKSIELFNIECEVTYDKIDGEKWYLLEFGKTKDQFTQTD